MLGEPLESCLLPRAWTEAHSAVSLTTAAFAPEPGSSESDCPSPGPGAKPGALCEDNTSTPVQKVIHTKQGFRTNKCIRSFV